jgi:two-component system chemotaxis response regulator CheB
MIKVMVVDDSVTARLLLRRILADDPEVEVVAECVNGQEAVELAMSVRPDVITMDVFMPVMDGLEATRRIMEESPRPIILVSASFNPKEVKGSFRALDAGALTILGKPSDVSSPTFSAHARELVRTVKSLAGVKVVTRRARRSREVEQDLPAKKVSLSLPARERVDIIAIVASTGGPSALSTILGAMPEDTPVPIVIVQHIGMGFDEGLVNWLDGVTPLSVRLGSGGRKLLPGEVVIAPHGQHMGVSRTKRVDLSMDEPIGGHRPSGNFLFRSLVPTYGANALGVLLTGIGDDGARGLLELKQAGGRAVVQDEASSVVYGMPKAASELGAADVIAPLNEIAAILMTAMRRNRSGSAEAG